VFVPTDFVAPTRLETDQFVLEPLSPQHNDSDYAAWSSSKAHIHATPGWEKSRWPDDRDIEANRADLERHADDFRNRAGFTYTVLDPVRSDVIGCVYIYPVPESDHDARVLSWIRADRAELDAVLWRAVSDWITADWPFASVDYAVRN
jgi:RimJ/RimL family protein N-acetyltransferase